MPVYQPEAESNPNRSNIKLCSTVISAVPDLTSSSKESVIFQCHMSLFPKFLPCRSCWLASENYKLREKIIWTRLL